MFNSGKIDRVFMLLTAVLVVAGFFIFSSASLGVLASNEGKFSNVAFNQLFLGIFLGSLACIVFARIDYSMWRKLALPIFILSIILTLLVFAPHIGFGHGGAKRWIDLGFITFQPSELLKIGFVMYLAAWLSKNKDGVKTVGHGLIPFMIMLGMVGTILLLQPDTDTFAVILFAATIMFIVSGARWSHLLLIGMIAVLGLAFIAHERPYIRERIEIFINPSAKSQTSGYQIQQSLIAVGSGGVSGRGFGKSLQKFSYLPEPIGDSIFAVAAEEFGFVGSSLIIILFLLFGFRGLRIASHAGDSFGRLLCIGIVILIMSQMFVNVCGMIGLLPLTGIPLPFISHGGTALLVTLMEAGIIMNISKKHRR